MDKFTIGSSPTDLKRTYTEAFYAAVPDVESYQPIKEVSSAEDLLNAMREPAVPFTIVKMTAVTLNACPAGRFRTFCEALKHSRSIRTVTVTIDDAECQALVDALSVNRSVTRVNLTVRYLDVDVVEKMLTVDTCQKLSDTLTRNHVLKKLHLTIRSQCLAIFTILGKSFVRSRKSLEVALVVEDKMGKVEFEHLIDALTKTNITTLKIGYYFSGSYNGFTARSQCSVEGTQLLCDYIRRSGCLLEILKLRTPLNFEQAKQFAQMINANPKSLKTFYYETHSTYNTADTIVTAMIENTTIRKFLIFDVPAREISGDLFKNLLKNNDTLESFSLSNCSDIRNIWRTIADTLPNKTSLRELHLIRSTLKKSLFVQDKDETAKIGRFEGQDSLQYIEKNHSLTKLVLDTVIGGQVIPAIESVLERNRNEQNKIFKDTIIIMYNIARTTTFPIDIWAHIFKHIRFYGVARNFDNILVDIYNNPVPRRVVD
jgi:hypothetical protein